MPGRFGKAHHLALPNIEYVLWAIVYGLVISNFVGVASIFRPGVDTYEFWLKLGITKAGNAYLRSLLIECANHILRPHGRDSALRQWGLHLAARGGKQAKNKSVVEFLDWAMKSGQDDAKKLDYVPMPDNVIKLIEASWSKTLKVQP